VGAVCLRSSLSPDYKHEIFILIFLLKALF